HFGASADYKTLFREFGFTAEAVTAAAQRSLARAKRSLHTPLPLTSSPTAATRAN
ncbi:transketolase, partial [Rhodococcus opacus M213]